MNTLRLPTLEGIRPRRFGLVSWSPHVAFAFDLVADLRPRMLVELGTHSGESYFAFCQSTQDNHTATTCYAVDTWKGDPQAGFYPEEVYAEVYRHNQEHYADFSYLVRATFDEAIDQFTDGSLDLIHFDGLHTYEAVKHDLERWRAKLSPRGVALFHDIAARHDDFGAWKLWEELRHEGQSFAFRHGWGLGVWKPGGGQPTGSPLLETLFAANEADAENIRRYYLLATDALRLQKSTADNRRLDESLQLATSRADGLSQEGARRDEALRETAARCEEALRVQAVLREEALQRDGVIRQAHAEREEALRVQAVLREEALQRDEAIRQAHAEREEALRVQAVLREEALQRDEAIRQAHAEREEALRVQAVLREEALQRDGAIRQAHAEREEALRVQAVLREEALQRDGAIRQAHAEREEALRVQAVLREEALQRDEDLRSAHDELANRRPPATRAASLQVYFSREGIFHAEDSLSMSLEPEHWQRITVPLPTGWRGGALRLDPGDGCGLADVAGVRIYTTTLGEKVWSLLGGALKQAAVAGGTAQIVPGARTLRMLCAGHDPQILLSGIDVSGFDEPLTLEIGIRLRTELPGMIRTFQELAAETSEWPALQARVRNLTEELAATRKESARSQEEGSTASRRQREEHAEGLRSLREALLESQNCLSDLEAELQGVRDVYQAAREGNEASGREIVGLQSELHSVDLRLADKADALDAVYRQLVDKDARLIAALASGEADHRRLRSMRRSASWKLTLPLRAAHRFLTGKTTARKPQPTPPAPVPAMPVAAKRAYHFQIDTQSIGTFRAGR